LLHFCSSNALSIEISIYNLTQSRVQGPTTCRCELVTFEKLEPLGNPLTMLQQFVIFKRSHDNDTALFANQECNTRNLRKFVPTRKSSRYASVQRPDCGGICNRNISSGRVRPLVQMIDILVLWVWRRVATHDGSFGCDRSWQLPCISLHCSCISIDSVNLTGFVTDPRDFF